jgi:hypothetical protein
LLDRRLDRLNRRDLCGWSGSRVRMLQPCRKSSLSPNTVPWSYQCGYHAADRQMKTGNVFEATRLQNSGGTALRQELDQFASRGRPKPGRVFLETKDQPEAPVRSDSQDTVGSCSPTKAPPVRRTKSMRPEGRPSDTRLCWTRQELVRATGLSYRTIQNLEDRGLLVRCPVGVNRVCYSENSVRALFRGSAA